jgi:hypothetical protein
MVFDRVETAPGSHLICIAMIPVIGWYLIYNVTNIKYTNIHCCGRIVDKDEVKQKTKLPYYLLSKTLRVRFIYDDVYLGDSWPYRLAGSFIVLGFFSHEDIRRLYTHYYGEWCKRDRLHIIGLNVLD